MSNALVEKNYSNLISVIEYDICDTFDGIYTGTSQPLISVKNEKCAVPEHLSR